MSGLNLSYGRLRALSDINLTVQSGELVALAGENGAGKTTLVRCIAGDVVPASGEIYLGGKRVPPDPGGAARQGLAVVWQDLALCDNLDIAANIMLGQESRRLMLAGLTAGIMGIIYASQLGSVSSNVPGGQNVLFAVAAAVIGGVSLFGGRGKMLGAVLGGVIVAVIYNGLQLLGLGASPQYIWTAIVLLAAVTIDTVARRSQART